MEAARPGEAQARHQRREECHPPPRVIAPTRRSRRNAADDIVVHAARVLAIALMVALYALFVGTTEGREIDSVLARRDLRPSPAGVWLVIAALSFVLLSPIGVALTVLALFWQARRLGRRYDGIRGALTVVAAVVGARVFEGMAQMLDPLRGEAARQLGSGFYPSGHAAAAMALCLAAIMVLRDQRWRSLLFGAIWCSAHGFVIFATHAHHISDVLGGFVLGFTAAALIGLRASSLSRLPERAEQKTILVMPAGIVAAVLTAQMAREMATSSLPPRVVLATAAAGLCAAAFALVYTFVRLLGSATRQRTDQAREAFRHGGRGNDLGLRTHGASRRGEPS